ncbi:uncharacterized protein GLRG_11802 [Colletotrichum graminicola M1.001]|uniref:Uncharacterized protein n=1 Tax=Colletotrichum graminicola (strain M1.001 / M2 / FGSC 10212) TaxID=645133 RepID=E3R0L8_COLGM|nr:uncharacterized protein GLRG_11802 [Colletotrichum graminicola M1.001]EFQ36656.1 hypothetical protein GLRG_11802 [Colletotrichum graminicola M1.001]
MMEQGRYLSSSIVLIVEAFSEEEITYVSPLDSAGLILQMVGEKFGDDRLATACICRDP